MDNDNNLACGNEDSVNEQPECPTKVQNAQPKKKRGINLLKYSKHDLLRMLSILEGELEARDIFISALQAQISNQRNARQQYFVHRLTDPFLSLHRDDYLSGNPLAPNNSKNVPYELARIEPLPLLEKVVYQFKTQQMKMHQQMALASKIHRKMAHELAEEKRKHAVDTKTGDDVTMALEKERERLRASVLCEKARTKRIESEYKKLLGLCKQEGKKHKMIVLMLLEEQRRLMQQLKESKELQIDLDSTETELQARLHEALKEKHELATRLCIKDAQFDKLQTRARELQSQVDQFKASQRISTNTGTALEQAFAFYKCDDDDDHTPELPIKSSKAYPSSQTDDTIPDANTGEELSTPTTILAKHHPMSVAQSSQDVTLIPTSSHPPILLADGVEWVTTSGYYSVKPGSSIAGLDAMKSAAQSKEILNMEPSSEPMPMDLSDGKVSDQEVRPSSLPRTDKIKASESLTLNLQPQPPVTTGPPKPNRFVPSSPLYSPVKSPHSVFMERNHLPMTSSPTSGAANFAMNSPNSPTPPLASPFTITRTPSVKASARVAHSIAEIGKSPTRGSKELGKVSSPGRTPIKTSHSVQFQATRQKFQNPPGPGNNDVFVAKKGMEPKNPASKENQRLSDKKLPAKKFSAVNYKSHITQKVSPVTPLPNVTMIAKGESSVPEIEKVKPLPPKTRPTTAPSPTTDQVRPPPLPPKKPNWISDKAGKRIESKKMDSTSTPRKITSVKRTVPLNTSAKANLTETTNSSNAANKQIKAPIPPSLPVKMSSQQPVPPASTRPSLSAQQRLFPSTGTEAPVSPMTRSPTKT